MNKELKVKQRKGSILVLAVSMVVILSIIGLAMIQLGLNARLQAIRSQFAIEAKTAADAGLEKALNAMRTKLATEYTWNNSSLPSETDVALPGSNATYTYTVSGDPNSGWNITSTSTCRNIQKTIHAKLVVKSSWFGIGVKQGINIKNAATFGTYPVNDGSLILRTNSINTNGVTLKAGVTIPGDVVCGPGGDPAAVIDTKASTTITGSTYAADSAMDFPSVVVPPELTALTEKAYVFGNEPNIAGDKHFGDVRITGKQLVAGNSRIFIDGTLIMDNGAELIVKSGASLKIYLNGNLEDKNSGGISNENNDARTLMLFATDVCTKIVLKAKGDFFGAIYAPNADMTIDNSADLYGAYVGNQNIEIKNSGAFYFDTRLLSVFVNDAPAYLGLAKGSWWEE
jgi:Tfp pilus assembly protein PilX